MSSEATVASPKQMQDCSYRNTSDRMVILRCCGSDQFFLERVVFPFELLAFACPPMSEVKIWSHGLYGPELLESFLSESLLADRPAPHSIAEPEGMFPPSTSATLQTTPWLQAS
ncbi:MAG: DUF1830 domain-containing protein [Cyanobacteriota bacterium]|jgi:hypothetical protein